MHCITRYMVYDFFIFLFETKLIFKKERKKRNGCAETFYLVIDRSNFLLFICLYGNLVPDLF